VIRTTYCPKNKVDISRSKCLERQSLDIEECRDCELAENKEKSVMTEEKALCPDCNVKEIGKFSVTGKCAGCARKAGVKKRRGGRKKLQLNNEDGGGSITVTVDLQNVTDTATFNLPPKSLSAILLLLSNFSEKA
jgi:hypothetical protein